jgi:hypothetical protein
VTGPAPELQRPVTARRTAVGHRRGKKGKKAVPAKRRRREGSGPNPKGQSFGKNVLLRFGVSST